MPLACEERVEFVTVMPVKVPAAVAVLFAVTDRPEDEVILELTNSALRLAVMSTPSALIVVAEKSSESALTDVAVICRKAAFSVVVTI